MIIFYVFIFSSSLGIIISILILNYLNKHIYISKYHCGADDYEVFTLVNNKLFCIKCYRNSIYKRIFEYKNKKGIEIATTSDAKWAKLGKTKVRVVRVLVYEAAADDMRLQLGRSMNQGIFKTANLQITIHQGPIIKVEE